MKKTLHFIAGLSVVMVAFLALTGTAYCSTSYQEKTIGNLSFYMNEGYIEDADEPETVTQSSGIQGTATSVSYTPDGTTIDGVVIHNTVYDYSDEMKSLVESMQGSEEARELSYEKMEELSRSEAGEIKDIERDTVNIDGIEYPRIRYRNEDGSQLTDYLMVEKGEDVYNIIFLTFQEENPAVTNDRNMFFESLSFSGKPKEPTSELLEESYEDRYDEAYEQSRIIEEARATPEYRTGFILGRLTLFAVIALIAFLVIRGVRKSKKSKESNSNGSELGEDGIEPREGGNESDRESAPENNILDTDEDKPINEEGNDKSQDV